MLVYMNMIDYWFRIDRWQRYLFTGGYNTIFSFLLFCLLEFLLHKYLHYLLILLITHLISVLNSFITMRYFVFRSHGHIISEYLRVNIVYAIYFIANAFLLYITQNVLHINIVISQLFCICILTCATYFAHKYFSFQS